VPNAETLAALRQARAGKELTEYANLEDQHVSQTVVCDMRAMAPSWLVRSAEQQVGRRASVRADLGTVGSRRPGARVHAFVPPPS
jgi:hypothetical protein